MKSTDSSFSPIKSARLFDVQRVPSDGKVIVGYVLHCKFTRNNTLITLTSQYTPHPEGKLAKKMKPEELYLSLIRPQQEVKFTVTAGMVGFRHTKQGEYEAGFQTAAKVFQMIKDKEFLTKVPVKSKSMVQQRPLEIILSEFGKGREAFLNCLNSSEGNHIRPYVGRVTDGTKIKIGGVRPPRARRV